jgi:hypothetical protein
MKTLWCCLFCLLFAAGAMAQSIVSIDKLERKSITEAKTDVGFSALVEGAVSSSDLVVYIMVYQPHLKAWRLFPAVMDEKAEAGNYHWRAICQFGELNGKGVGSNYQVKAVAFDSAEIKKNGLPKTLPLSIVNSNAIDLKRIR